MYAGPGMSLCAPSVGMACPVESEGRLKRSDGATAFPGGVAASASTCAPRQMKTPLVVRLVVCAAKKYEPREHISGLVWTHNVILGAMDIPKRPL